jgi:hypothetical protein
LVLFLSRSFSSSTELPIVNTLDPTHPHASTRSASEAAAAAALKKLKLNDGPTSRGASDDPLQADTPRGASKPAAGSEHSPLKGNWNATITELTTDVVSVVREFDAELWDETIEQIQREFQAAQRSAQAFKQQPKMLPGEYQRVT